MDRVAVLEILLTLCVITVQVRCFLATRRRSQMLANLFPNSEPMAEILPSTLYDPIKNESIVESTRIEAVENASPGFNSILYSTNRYLDANVGTPADIRILQDIAERVSSATEQAAAANATLPLYVGLMGTFIGVIVGLMSLAGGLSPLANQTTSNAAQALINDPSKQNAFTDPSHLWHFVGGVLIAMAGSFCGLFLSVIGRSIYLRNAQAKNDRLKQAYFTLLQTELLPKVGHDVTAALYSLQNNLHRFNEDFSSNLASFSSSMGTASETLRQQRELLDMLRSADIFKIIEANAEMLRDSEVISERLKGFIDATATLQKNLQTTNELTDKFIALLDRIQTFEQSVNSLGNKLAVDQTVTISTVKLIQEQLESLKSRTELIRQYTDIQDDKIMLFIEQQRQKLDNLIIGAQQQLDDLATQIAHSVANALSDGQGTVVLSNVARLQGIDEQITGIATLVGQMQQSSKEAEAAVLQAIKDGPGGLSGVLDQHKAKLTSIDGHIANVETLLANVQPPGRQNNQTNVPPKDGKGQQRRSGKARRVWRWPSWSPFHKHSAASSKENIGGHEDGSQG